MQMCACLNENMSPLCVLRFLWFARAALLVGIVNTATGKAYNNYKTLGQLGLVCV